MYAGQDNDNCNGSNTNNDGAKSSTSKVMQAAESARKDALQKLLKMRLSVSSDSDPMMGCAAERDSSSEKTHPTSYQSPPMSASSFASSASTSSTGWMLHHQVASVHVTQY